MKTIYLIRHCKALGQKREADLTREGITQSHTLSLFLANKGIEKVISSPFVRAVQSIKPFVDQTKVTLTLDSRLSERILSSNDLTDWMDQLKATFENQDLKFEGGESSNEASKRGIEVITELIKGKENTTAIVTHGNLLSLIIRNYNKEFGFNEWKDMRNPDVFELSEEQNEFRVKRIWK